MKFSFLLHISVKAECSVKCSIQTFEQFFYPGAFFRTLVTVRNRITTTTFHFDRETANFIESSPVADILL